jgi:hypothetical protein
MDYKDNIPGGVGDNNLPLDFCKKQLVKGVKIEMEHIRTRRMM